MDINFQNLKTEETKVDEVLNDYDLDSGLETHYNNLGDELVELKIKYQAFMHIRRIYNGKTQQR